MSIGMVELHPAAWWCCDVCGHEHFIRVTELSEPGETPRHAWVRFPKTVKCANCTLSFEVEYVEPQPEGDE